MAGGEAPPCASYLEISMTHPSFDHVGLAARDVPRAVEFYVRLLDGRPEPLGHHTIVRTGSVAIAITPWGDDEPASLPRGHHVAIRFPAAETERWWARVEALGAPFEDAPGRRYLRDPDGNVIELVPG